MTSDDRSPDPSLNLIASGLDEFLEFAAKQVWPREVTRKERSKSIRFALGKEPIQLGNVEFGILLFLASRPYHAFTSRNIADAVSSPINPISEDQVEQYISSLRDQLGPFHDYVQTVPYIGYRFKE